MVSKQFPNVAIVILNWNGRKFLEQFLPIVIKYSAGSQIIVADNASADDSVVYLKVNFPEVRIILNGKNLGFCEGYNAVLQQVQAEYFVLLNSDVEVTPDWLAPIIGLMDSDARIAACQPKIKSYYQREYFEYAGAGGGFIDYLGYPFCRGRIFESIEKDGGQYNDIRPVFWATGACMFVRAKTFRQLGGLETAFFAHMEEIDLCWRMHNAGYKVMYCGLSEIYHVGGGTLPKSSPRKTYLNFRNGLALLYKNSPSDKLIRIFFIRVILDWVAAIKFILDGQWQDSLAVLKAHWHLYKKRKFWKQKRRQSPEKVNLPDTIIYKESIVWNYFVKRKKLFSDLKIPDRTPLTTYASLNIEPEG